MTRTRVTQSLRGMGNAVTDQVNELLSVSNFSASQLQEVRDELDHLNTFINATNNRIDDLSQEEFDREVAKREAMKATEDEGPGGPNQ